MKKIRLENEDEGVFGWVIGLKGHLCRGLSTYILFSRITGVPSTAIREISLLKELKHDHVVQYVCKQSALSLGLFPVSP